MPIFHDPESKLLAELRDHILKEGKPYEKDIFHILQKTGYEACLPFLVGTYTIFEDEPIEVVMAMKNTETALLFTSKKGKPYFAVFDNESGKLCAAYYFDNGTLKDVMLRHGEEFSWIKNARDAAGLETRVEEITAEEFAERIVGTMRREHPLLVESVTAAFKNTVNRHRPPWYTRAYRAVKRVFKKGQ